MRRILVVAAGCMALLSATAGTAAADPSGTSQNASCMAVKTWLSTHHPGVVGNLDRAEVAALTKRVADELGIPPGEINSALARFAIRGDACLA